MVPPSTYMYVYCMSNILQTYMHGRNSQVCNVNVIHEVVFEGFHGEDTCERGLRLHTCILSWESDGGPEKGPLVLDCFEKFVLIVFRMKTEDDKYKLI